MRAKLIEILRPAVVQISVDKEGELSELRERFNLRIPPRSGVGSGSIISQDGYILTNNHVIEEASSVSVQLADGREFEAEIIGSDPLSDIAVIKIDAEDLPTIGFGDSDYLQIGETVIAIGNPFGLSLTVTMGIVSAKGRDVGVADYEDFIQTDAAINPGSSGGPLINLEGKLVGVNTAIFSRNGGYQGIGLAVPINMASRIADDLIKHGKVKRGWLGVSIQDIDRELAEKWDLETHEGSLVTEVLPDSPAEEAGLQRRDFIMTVNGKKIRNSNQLRNVVASIEPETETTFEIIRDGQKISVDIFLETRPQRVALQRSTPKKTSPIGVTVRKMDADASSRLGYDPPITKGVLITDVEMGSPAYRAGLLSGYVILEVENTEVNSVSQFERLIEEGDLKKGIVILTATPNGSRFVVLHR